MMKFEVYGESTDRSGFTDKFATVTWLDVSDVFSVRPDRDPDWSVLTFRPSTGLRSFIVRGTAETVAALITAEKDRRSQAALNLGSISDRGSDT